MIKQPVTTRPAQLRAGSYYNDPYLVAVIALLLISLVGKSQLACVTAWTWRVQMVLTALFAGASLWLAFLRATSASHQVPARQPPRLPFAILSGFLVVGVLSSFVQDKVTGNLAYAMVYAGVVTLLFLAPFRSRRASSYHYMWAAGCLLGIMTGANLVAAVLRPSWVGGDRFYGVHFIPIITGQMSGLGAIFFLWMALAHRARRTRLWLWWLLFGMNATMLVMSRTRGSMVAAAVACIACLLFTYQRSLSGKRMRMALILGFCVVALAVAVVTISSRERFGDQIRSYLRVGHDIEETISSRSRYWQFGTETLRSSGELGYGPLARYQGELSVAESTYDPERNPHNGILSAFQAYGWVGGCLYLMLWASLAASFLSRRDHAAVLGLSVLVFGMVQSVSENWLHSFGTPSDLFSWVLLGSAICCVRIRSDSRDVGAITAGSKIDVMTEGPR